MVRRRRGIPRSFPLIWLVLAVPLLALAVAYALFDPNSLKPRIESAASQALGRAVVLRGGLHLALSPTPTLEADDIGLENPPGFSRPAFATLGQAQAQLALWPLLQGRIEIARLVLVRPDVRLETNAQGQVNWRLGPAAAPVSSGAPSPSPSPSPAPAAAAAARGAAPRFDVRSLRITDGRLAWADAAAGVTRTATIDRLDMTESQAPDPGMSATAALQVAGHAVTVTAELGTLAQLMTARDGTPWPVQVVLRTEGARFAAAGSIAHPLDGRGYALTLDASAPDLGTLGALLGTTLPALRDVSATAKLSESSGAPELTQLAAHAGPSTLVLAGRHVALDRLELATPSVDQPVHAEVQASVESTKVQLTGDIGTLRTMLAGAPLPLSVSLQVADALLRAKGSVAPLQGLGGVNLGFALMVPDLAGLSGVAMQTLPPLRDLTLSARLAPPEGQAGPALTLSDIQLKLPQADATGDLTLTLGARPALRGRLVSQSLDLDALSRLVPVAPSKATAPAAPAAPAHPAVAGAAAPPGPPGSDLAALDAADGDVTLAIGALQVGGVALQNVAAHAVLSGGRLSVDPASATLAGGHLEGTLSLAAPSGVPAVTLGLSAPGLPVKPLMALLGLPDNDSGTVELSADLSTSGATRQAMMHGLTGRLGVAATDGLLDNRLLGSLGEMLRGTRLPVDLLTGAQAGQTRFRCMAVRADFTDGAGSVGPIVLDSARLLVQGAGTVNLNDGALALRLRPMLRTGGPGIVVPVRVSGTLSHPNVATDGGAAKLGGLSLNRLLRNPLATLGNTLVGERGGDACGPAITAARGARPGGK